MEIRTERRNRALLVHVADARIDAAVAIRFKDAMRDVIMEPSERVILDLSQVTFLDSSGLGAVVAVMKMLPSNRPLELSGLTPTVEKVFRLTRMDRVFTIHPDAPTAEDPGRLHAL